MGFWKNAIFCGALALSPLLGGCGDDEENEDPVVYAVPDQTVQEGEAHSLNLMDYVSDPDGDAVTIEHIGGPGSIAGGQFSYQDAIDPDDVNNEHTVDFMATDGNGGEAMGSFRLTQQDTQFANENPVIQPIADQSVNEGEILSIGLDGLMSDPDGDDLTVIVASGPGLITSGNIYEYIDRTDNDLNNNEHDVLLRVTDGRGGEATASFLITQNDTYYFMPPLFFNTKINWIAYAPTNFDPNALIFPDEASVREDLRVLRDANFRGIVTYGSDNILSDVPRIAKEEGFDYVVMGIWDFNNAEEWANALARQDSVDAYCVGNEGISSGRYTLVDVEPKMDELRRATNKPVTTTEPLSMYDSALLGVGDWIFPNIHPYWSGVKEPNAAASWTKQQFDDLIAEKASLGIDSMVVMKEVGLPTGGEAGLSEANQNTYYRDLENLTSNYSAVAFVYFEAFDQPWKDWAPVEPYWGLFKQDRSSKAVLQPQIAFTYIPPIGSFQNLRGSAANAKPEDYKVSVYINVGGMWWMKPTWANPMTSISQSASWVTDITTGGNDASATAVFAALVTPDYSPVRNRLPVISDPKVIHVIQEAK